MSTKSIEAFKRHRSGASAKPEPVEDTAIGHIRTRLAAKRMVIAKLEAEARQLELALAMAGIHS